MSICKCYDSTTWESYTTDVENYFDLKYLSSIPDRKKIRGTKTKHKSSVENVGQIMIHKSGCYTPPTYFNETDNENNNIRNAVRGMSVPDIIRSFQAGLPCAGVDLTNLPIVMSGRDMIASTQSVSEKIAAFILPTLNIIMNEQPEMMNAEGRCKPLALIVVHTMGLVQYIYDVIIRLSRGTSIKCIEMYGVASDHQIREIMCYRNFHIIVATPDGLCSYLSYDLITFSGLRLVVFDETDLLFKIGFISELEALLNHKTMVSTEQRTTVFYSTDMSKEVKNLATRYLKSDYLRVFSDDMTDNILQTVLLVSEVEKRRALLNSLTEIDDCLGVIVFVELKSQADSVTELLNANNYPAIFIDNDKEQLEIEQALQNLNSGDIKILVLTGTLDNEIELLIGLAIIYDLPKTIVGYLDIIRHILQLDNFVEVVSFYDPEGDAAITSDLVSTLKEAEQNVPIFLSQMMYDGVVEQEYTDATTEVEEL